MNHFLHHKARYNFIITLIRAVKVKSWRFRDCRLNKLVAIALLFVSISQLSAPAVAEAYNPSRANIPFGREETVNIFPTQVVTDEWAGIEHVLSQDLNDGSLYQDFTALNSAYVPQSQLLLPVAAPEVIIDESDVSPAAPVEVFVPVVPVEPEAAPVAASTTQPDVTTEADVVADDVQSPEVVPEPTLETSLEEEVIAEPVVEEVVDESVDVVVPDVTEPSVEPISFFDKASTMVWGVFAKATNVFPFAQQSVISSTSDSEPEGADPVVEDVVEDSDPLTTNSISATSSTEVELEVVPVPVEITPEVLGATTSDLIVTPLEPPVDTMPLETIEAPLDAPALSPAVVSDESQLVTALEQSAVAQSHTLTLVDFSTAQLASGQFITGMQLRLSLAAQLQEVASGTLPYVEVLFGTPEDMQVVGSIIIEDEVSNALNGGFFLFALPVSSSVDDLSGKQVVLRYVGDASELDGMYLDAAWIEMDTKVITQEDIEARGVAEQLKHLHKTEIMEMMSTKLNFKRSETPVFNLKYSSQRNALVRGFRSVIGRSLAKVEKVDISHVSLGQSGITPDVVVTSDGLISISIPEEDLYRLRPGTYQVTVSVDEGGYETTESFDFQWGILSINPNKTEYQRGETITLSMGALTPNGNTVCEANLELYHTSPNGFIEKLPVTPSGECRGNTVVDSPDFSASAVADLPGEHILYLERLDDDGNVLGFTTDTFFVVSNQLISIERNGPTRIFPPAPYPMTLTVASEKSFTGTLTERVPANFEIFDTDAEITRKGEWKELKWELSMFEEESRTVSYRFDAPDISPYLYELGPARLVDEAIASESRTVRPQETASSTASTTVAANVAPTSLDFEEHRQWQIASDAIGNMVLLWANGASVPSGWTCISCAPGDAAYQRLIMGSSTASSTGGTASSTHTFSTSILQNTAATVESGNGGPAINTHEHTLTPTSSNESNYPLYRTLRVIEYTAAAGEPGLIPNGAIALFDVASSSLPTGWNRYDAQDGRYVVGADTPATNGGANTHTHTISGTTSAAAGGDARTRGNPTQTTAATVDHTHFFSTTTAAVDHQPPYVEVLLAQVTSNASATNDMIAMWTNEAAAGWTNMSDDGDIFSNRFFKPATTYGTTGGTTTHSHDQILGATTDVPSATTNGVQDLSTPTGADPSHQHDVNLTNFSSENSLPPYITFVFAKRQGADTPLFTQLSSRWFVNANTKPATDPWPSGATNLTEREPITATSTPVSPGDVLRLRINALVSNATATASSSYALQYASTTAACSASLTWYFVGDSASSTLWRGYTNGGVADGSALSSTTLASTTVLETYEDDGVASTTENDIDIGDVGEWDFVLEPNGAEAGTNYCFRMVEEDGTSFLTYSHYPRLLTNAAPDAPTLSKLFDNEKTPSTSPWFQFSATDDEGEDVHYQIQVDDDYSFASPLLSSSTDDDDDSAYFENQVSPSAKAPYTNGNLIEFQSSITFASGTTYYWRVRASDPDGSNTYGDWSTIRSFTIDPNLSAASWFQTTEEQFDADTLEGVEALAADTVELISGSSTGTTTSGSITFTDGEVGTAWDSFRFSDDETNGTITYYVEYLNESSAWELVPDGDLSGNSSGFTNSPVSLLTLDVDAYATIRIVAVFVDVTGTPTLSDWEVRWGFRVETPTISKLFANEQTGTTTPSFEFTTTDPQEDGLTYQVQWSTTPDFAASTTRTSDTDAGFLDLSTGSTSDPFDSGNSIRFTIQSGDALTGSTTYWWRVRAKDTTGVGAYSFWTDAQSFTVIPGTEVSTWFQTTRDQFDTNILSGTIALSSDVVAVATTASEAMMIYGEGTENIPRYRQWDGDSWSTEGTMQTIGAPLRWAIVKAGTTREEYVAATVGTDNDINVQVFSTGAWDNLQELSVAMGNTSARGFDVAYESLSGRALVVYCNSAADPLYYIWNGSSWNAGTSTLNVSETTNCEWIKLASDPTSNEIIAITRGSDGNPYEAQVWNGSAWGNAVTIGSITETGHEGMAVEYEESGTQAVIVASAGNQNRFIFNTWNGSTWSGNTNFTLGGDFEWGTLVRDVGTDSMAACLVDDTNDIAVARWNGTTNAFTLDDDREVSSSKTEPQFACVFEDSPGNDGNILLTYSDASIVGFQQYTGSWSTEAQVDSITTSATMELIRTGAASVLGLFFETSSNDLLFSEWNGSNWSTTTIQIEDDASVDATPYGRPYSMAPRNSNDNGTTIVSPGIDFDDGLGPYWQEFSWNDSQPGSSEILYSLQYQTATGSWAFIPDSVLPDNEAGTSTGPFDLSNLNTNTYNVIRPYAVLTCDVSDNCPEIQDWKVEWAGGITISGTIQEFDQTTNVNAGTVAVAVNGVLQTGKTGSISAGTWSIDNVTAFNGDIITVYVSGATESSEAVAVARYQGPGNISGMQLFEQHLSLGSNYATTTPLTNTDVGIFDIDDDLGDDVFIDLTGTTLNLCGKAGCGQAELFINASTTYSPGGTLITHDFENNGTFTAGSNQIEVSGSWDNNATSTMTGSTLIFSATSTEEGIDTTGATVASFNNVTFGSTTASALWTASTSLDINGSLTVASGTLARGAQPITVSGSLSTGAAGFWSGVGTTTFDGSGTVNWKDSNATLQNVGDVVIDGTSKTVTLTGNVAANSVKIGADDTLDVSSSNYDITVYGRWNNQNVFVDRSGTVTFAATSSSHSITTNGNNFYDLTFNGVGGSWLFSESAITVDNDLTIATGTLTFPTTGTTTINGSFDATGGSFQHNNGTLYFTSDNVETITFDGGAFTNVARNLTFNGGGSWSIADTNATATNDVRITQGTVTFPTGILAIEGTLTDGGGGSFSGNGGTVRFYGAGTEVITAGGSSFASTTFDGAGAWSFADTNVTMTGSLLVSSGSLTLPSGALTIGGSYTNASTVIPGTGSVVFNSANTGETIDFGGQALYDVSFSSNSGGWTITTSATTTNDFSLASAASWALQSGQALSVGGTFTNNVGGASTTWTGTILSLEAGDYDINQKTDNGDSYETLRIKANTDVKVWNSSAATYNIDSTGSLYSQDHNTADGDLYIFGSYNRATGTEYWTNTTDFDGTDLSGGSERQVDVRFAAGASAAFSTSTLNITGSSTASTTIANQGGGTYTVSITGGTTTARYYEFSDLGLTGFSLLGATVVQTLRDGSYVVGADGGTAITLSSTTIDANPAKQIYNIYFATTTAISAANVTQTDGTPTSFWWFRNGAGNLYGEGFDNDTGNPGSVRFDDSALQLTISGTIYEADTTTPLGAPTCDNSTPVVRIMVDGVEDQTVSCNAGVFTANNVTVVGDPTLTVYLDDAPGGEVASGITRTPTVDITNFDLYENRIVLRNEDTDPLTIANLAVFDNSNDPDDLRFIAATSTTPDSLTVMTGNELRVFATSTFTPGGVVSLGANAAANDYDGSLYLEGDSVFNAYSSTTLTIGGRLELEAGATFEAASTSVVMNATTSGKSITANSEITFYDLSFTGSGGGWNLGTDIRIEGDMSVNSGTTTGNYDIYVESGDLTGNGKLSLGAGTTTMARTNTLGGNSRWTFYNLTLGDGATTSTTTPVFVSTTTVAGLLTISDAHFLDAGATIWDLSGTGTVFVESGTFLEDTSTIRYSGNGSNVLDTTYYNLDINAGAGSPTYTAINAGLVVTNNLTIGGDAPSTFDLTTNDPLVDVNGDVIIRSNGTLSASDSNLFTIAGSYDNNGTFTSNSGSTTFDGAGTVTIAAGDSTFGSVNIVGAGDFTVTEHATATADWTLTNHNTFTVSSGESLAVGGTFTNTLGGAATTWTGSTLRLYSDTLYTANTKTVSDTYGTLDIDGTTQVKLWNSDASEYLVDTTASLYSQDHADTAGDLYIFGTYQGGSQSDFWSYAKDFDGTALGGSSRVVDVYFATSSSLLITDGDLQILGGVGATTTVQGSATDLYDFRIGGTASVTMQYYAFRDMDAGGITFSGSPDIQELSNGDFELALTGSSTMTVGGSVLTANPARTFNYNRFALGDAASGFNITATGTALSAWRFFGHHGGIDGEDYDVDSGDPGELLWSDSTSTIDISGRVYSDEGTTVSGACSATTNIHLYVNGALEDTTSCDGGTGLYGFTDVSYNTGESVVIYINDEVENAVTVSTDLVSSVFNFDLYEDRLIVRHESSAPIQIADLDDWDKDNDAADIFFDAEGGLGTLVMDPDTKLIVWDSKEFEPTGDITTGGGAGDDLDGTVALQDDATLTLNNGESHSIGGNLEMGAGATLAPAQSTITFTSSGSGRTIDTNENGFYNLVINTGGTASSTDTVLLVANDLTLSGGTLALPAATTTISGSLITTSGSFDANSGIVEFDGAGTETISTASSSFADLRFTGTGDYSFNDTNATATVSMIVTGTGDVTLPSGTLVIGDSFRNVGGTITHNTSQIIMTNGSGGTILASTSDLYAVTINGAGSFRFEDTSLTLLDTLSINAGSLQLATTTLSVGGSFLATGGTFSNPVATSTVLFNSSDTGETINPGVSSFARVQIGAPTGGYTLTGNATTTQNFILASASDFTVQSGVVLYVAGVFQNSVGGSATTWLGSNLVLDGSSEYSINSKTDSGDQYDTLTIGQNSDLDMWNSAATTTVVAQSSSLYSQDHAAVDGALNIYGDYHISTTTEAWSYATDFDLTDLTLTSGERAVTVSFAANSTTTLSGGTLNIIGASGSETIIANQGAGTYAFAVTGGTLNAQYYSMGNLNADGLDLSGTPVISSLDNGSFTLAVDGGTTISLSSTTLNANASFVINNTDFATTSAISGNNVTLSGTTPSVWTFSGGSGNLYGESFDVDGGTACGSVRFDDSDCQIVQQTHYRWRNDDGGLGVPDDEWYSASWSARRSVQIDNADATTYTDAVVELSVAYDADMQSDFDDLRFTDSTGTTLIPHWVGSSTDSVAAEVWVKVPTLAASDFTTIYMYYNNPSATSSASSTETFIASDDFEDGDVAEYSGENSEFTVGSTNVWDGANSLEATDVSGRTSAGGIYDTNQTMTTGNTIRFLQYVVGGGSNNDEACTMFGIQSTAAPTDNYAFCTDLVGTERVVLSKDVIDNADSGTVLDSDSGTFTTGWYEVEIDWATSSIEVNVYDVDTGSLFATVSSTDSTYYGGGLGFTFWFQNGSWDSYTVRPTLTTEPSIRFGAEQVDGGASWAAAQDAVAYDFSPNETARLRVAIENTGTAITNQQMQLEYAEQGSAPSCEAVNPSTFAAVPVQASCGTSPVCMQSSTNVTNGAATADLLLDTEGTFTAGQAREDPSNATGNLNVAQNEYTEVEYVIAPTLTVPDPNLCFRVTNSGTDYDTYLKVAKMNVRFDPSFGAVYFNGGDDITLLGGTTTRVFATSTVTDLNGYTDIQVGTSTFYTTTATAACTSDNNDCYISSTAGQCALEDCSGDSCTLSCYADMYFHADPTDGDGVGGLQWFAFLEAEDSQGGVGFNTSSGVELLELRAAVITSDIDYGSLAASSTSATTPSTTVSNVGNVPIDIDIEATDLSDGASSVIDADEQKYATSSFTYSTCGAECIRASTTAQTVEVDLAKPTTDTPATEDELFWGIRVPLGTNSAPHYGSTLITPISD